MKIPQILQIKLMFTVQYYGPGCSRENSNVFQFSQIGKNVALSNFGDITVMHPLIKTLVITIYIDHKHISLLKGREKILHKLLCENGSFFPTYLLHFGYQLCNMSMNNFFYPAIVGAKQDWQTKVLLFPTEILFRHD